MGDFFQLEHNFPRSFFLWKFWRFRFSKLQDTKLSFQEIIYNFFYGKNLQILIVEILISRLVRLVFSRFLDFRGNIEHDFFSTIDWPLKSDYSSLQISKSKEWRSWRNEDLKLPWKKPCRMRYISNK